MQQPRVCHCSSESTDSRMEKQDEHIHYPIFKGLQHPLEFMGFQGRYITWAAITAASALLGFMLVYTLLGFIAALVWMVASISVGAGMILVRQRRGLHTKKEEKGVFIYASSTKL